MMHHQLVPFNRVTNMKAPIYFSPYYWVVTQIGTANFGKPSNLPQNTYAIFFTSRMGTLAGASYLAIYQDFSCAHVRSVAAHLYPLCSVLVYWCLYKRDLGSESRDYSSGMHADYLGIIQRIHSPTLP